jgi:hypothetical protein
MTKGERRKLRKADRAAGRTFNIERRAGGGLELVAERTPAEERRHERAMHRWARRYEARNGAPEGWWDR